MGVSVALIEDRQAVRTGLRQILTAHHNIDVHEFTGSQPAVLDRLLSLRVDVVLVGEVDHVQDLALIRWLDRCRGVANFRILLLRDVRTLSEVTQVRAAGAHGYLPYGADEHQLVSGVFMVAGGGYAFLPGLDGPPPESVTEPPPDSVGLTRREYSVLSALAHGMSNAEIAKDMCITEATVKKHLSQVLAKIGQPDRLRAGLYAYRHGLHCALR
ncbi:response regulator transcription factor [Actinomadura rubrisoli]|uniref:Response regulator transcription factor n=1 Tax=Actinomadura rubrisoli TaxID=2530368 RepID=A0A4R5BFA5_9ACTN|nr:response regulator transcription factor [Actinomadura rubrisoli]TDD85021.1 response regulator transcription factor [Actinomadura rubrisoli]